MSERETSQEKDQRFNNTTHPRIRGRCPSCRAESLFLGSGGYVTCSVIGCKDPGAPHDLLAADFPSSLRLQQPAERLSETFADGMLTVDGPDRDGDYEFSIECEENNGHSRWLTRADADRLIALLQGASSPSLSPVRTAPGEEQTDQGPNVVAEDQSRQIQDLQQQLAEAQAERDRLRMRAVMAEHHKSLSLMGRSSYAEAVEDKLRMQLAEAEVARDAAQAEQGRLRSALEHAVRHIDGDYFYGDEAVLVAALRRQEQP